MLQITEHELDGIAKEVAYRGDGDGSEHCPNEVEGLEAQSRDAARADGER